MPSLIGVGVRAGVRVHDQIIVGYQLHADRHLELADADDPIHRRDDCRKSRSDRSSVEGGPCERARDQVAPTPRERTAP